MPARPTKRSKPRPVLVAPDKFKGTFSAMAVADAIAAALERSGIEADRCPVADGGDGTLDVLVEQLGGQRQQATVRGPLGDPAGAAWALFDDRAFAVVESAQAAGLAVLQRKPDAWRASSYGVGQLLAEAFAAGARQVMIGAGGTATTDGGAGAIEALRDAGFEQRPRGVTLTVLCDVRTPWELAAATFAPQKGAGPKTVEKLAARLDQLAATLPKDPRGVTSGGAGGGLAGGLWAAYGAELKSGAAYVLDVLGFNERMLAARGVITGEGRLDHQTLHGKAAGEVATRCRQAGVPCHAIVGQNALPPFEQRLLDIESVHQAPALENVPAAVAQIIQQLPPH